MSQPVPRPATYADIEALSSNMVGEIIFGALHAYPRPSPRHGVMSTELQVELGPPFRRGSGGPGGWVFIVEPALHLGDHVIVPDIAGWRRKRLPHLPETAWIETPPDRLCEALSPSTAQKNWRFMRPSACRIAGMLTRLPKHSKSLLWKTVNGLSPTRSRPAMPLPHRLLKSTHSRSMYSGRWTRRLTIEIAT